MKYKIKQTSPFLYIVTFMLTFLIGLIILISITKHEIIPKGQPLIFMLCFAPIMILAFYLPKFTSTVEIEIEIDENGISRKWIKQFIFQNKIDNKIKWNEIENYVFQPDRQFDKFKLNLKSNRKFVFYHNNDHDTKDDFIAFVSDFAVKVNEINSEENKSKEEKIKLGKTIYETTGGLILAILGVILIVGLPILFILSPHKGSVKTSNYAMLGASYLGTIYYLVQVYTHRKKRKEYEENL